MVEVLRSLRRTCHSSKLDGRLPSTLSRRGTGEYLVLTLLLAAMTAISVVPSGCTNVRQPRNDGALSSFDFTPVGKRLLIVAPHPDDEGLATAGLIQQALAQDIDVRVVIMTSGDASVGAVRAFTRKTDLSAADFRKVGNARAHESRDALMSLGLPSNDVIFLAYADGSLNSLWDSAWDYSHLHTGCNGAKHAPYQFAYEKGAPYCGSNVEKNLTSIIKDFKPTAIIYPDAADEHHDHWAANAFVQYAVVRSRYRGAEYTYLVHRRDFPSPLSYRPLGYLKTPVAIRNLGTQWKGLPISRREEDGKAEALQTYTIPLMIKKGFIEAFVRRNELLGTTKVLKGKRIGNKKPDFTGKEMPYVVESDSPGDSAGKTGADIGKLTKVSFCLGDSKAYLAVETDGDIASDLTCAFRLRVFKGKKVDRFDINVRGSKARCTLLADNSVSLKSRIPVNVKANRLWIELPASVFSGAGACMLSVDSMTGHLRRVHRTAWRRLKL